MRISDWSSDVCSSDLVVLGIQLSLMAPPGVAMRDVERVLTFPVAAGQCRSWLASELPGAEVVAANSNAEAARLVGAEHDGRSAAVAPALAAKHYDPAVPACDIETHPEPRTRFVSLRPAPHPTPTANPQTTNP